MLMLQANQRQIACDRRGRPLWRVSGLSVATLLLLLVLAACADEGNDRQFANEPVTPAPTEDIPLATPAGASPVAPPRALASPEALVETHGAPKVIYAELGGALWAFDGERQAMVTAGPILAFAASPDGERVAVVTLASTEGGATYGVEVFTGDGERRERIDDVVTLDATGATPVADDGGGVVLSWSPNGERLLLAHKEGYLVDIPLDGEPRVIETRARLAGVTQAECRRAATRSAW
jgi:hypothetical protein